MGMSTSPGACAPNIDAATPAQSHASPDTSDNIARLSYIDVGESACPSSSDGSRSTDVSFPSAVEHFFQGHYGNLCWRCGPYAIPPLKAAPVFPGNSWDQERWQSAGLLSTDIHAYGNVLWLCLLCRNAFSRIGTRMFIVPTFLKFFKQAELMSHASNEPRRAPTAEQYAEYCQAQRSDCYPPLEWGLYTVYTVLGPLGSNYWVEDCLQWSGDPMAIVARMRPTIDLPLSLSRLEDDIGDLVDLYWEGGQLAQQRTSTAVTKPPASLTPRAEATTLAHELVHVDNIAPSTTLNSAFCDRKSLNSTPEKAPPTRGVSRILSPRCLRSLVSHEQG
ncbi:uncharacterized protein N0V89_012113 [Didymosphaeria variabile]|uniref:HNH nuclease domain-containing protein n=1 Tax=Didymosphaeria variabile TaxID=1932322 RepID=A0A9W8X8S5_9PLEO|nr:uncharacterized protein N0V89_012113 [Didymosphaeria variabile]KAJ4344373.1 hypothetical protein N0V89_012113 [Didymosphaeria variabile]